MLETHASDKLPPQYSGKFKGSFAYLTIKDRLPVILVKAIDTLCRDKNNVGLKYGEDAKEDIKEIIGRLSALQNEMTTNKPIKYLVSDDLDVDIWNTFLDNENANNTFPAAWFDSSWLYVECYLYRRIKEAFELSSFLKDYDPFMYQKIESSESSMNNIKTTGKILVEIISNLNGSNDVANKYINFARFLEIALWGNKCDLSMTAGKEIIQGNVHVENLKSKIIINNTELIWNFLKEVNEKSSDVKVHYVLDNAGFELFCDLCFIYFLSSIKLVKNFTIHAKRMPWFVSDTIKKDIDQLLETLQNSNAETLIKLSQAWHSKLITGEWTVKSEPFWTLPHDFSQMIKIDSKLYSDISDSDLVIFKGDLNYRKLTADRQWEETTSFETALNKFLPTSLLALRTIKSDVLVGLAPGTTEKMNKISQNWKFSGDYALIQFVKKV